MSRVESQPGLSTSPLGTLPAEAAAAQVMEDCVSVLQPLALRLEAFVYDRLCALSLLSPPDGNGDGGRRDELASPDPGAPHGSSSPGL